MIDTGCCFYFWVKKTKLTLALRSVVLINNQKQDQAWTESIGVKSRAKSKEPLKFCSINTLVPSYLNLISLPLFLSIFFPDAIQGVYWLLQFDFYWLIESPLKQLFWSLAIHHLFYIRERGEQVLTIYRLDRNCYDYSSKTCNFFYFGCSQLWFRLLLVTFDHFWLLKLISTKCSNKFRIREC